MKLSRKSNAARQPLRGDPSSIGLGGFNFSKRIVKKYSFSKRYGRLPALIFLRLFGRDTDRKNSVEKGTSPEWKINNYFEFHFYIGVIRIRYLVTQRFSAPQKFFRVSGDPISSYPAVQRDGLFPVIYTITGPDKPIVKPTVLPARHITGSYLQKGFNRVNTVPGYPATATKEPLRDKSEIPDGNMPAKYKMSGKNVLFPVLTPITGSVKSTLNSMDFSINNYSHGINAKDAFPKSNKTAYAPLSGIQNLNKESQSSESTLTKMKTSTYEHAPSEMADTGLTRQERFVKTVLNRNISIGLVLNMQKMSERLSGRKQGTFPDTIVPAKPDLHFASNSGKAEKPMRIEDTIDTVVRKYTDLILRKTSGDNIANNMKKQDVMRTTNEEVRESNINKSISHERKPGDVNTIADTVYKLIERRLLIEKEKRGLV